jgi:hypothetical protein
MMGGVVGEAWWTVALAAESGSADMVMIEYLLSESELE